MDQFLFICVLVALYFFPTIVARYFKHNNGASIFIVNLFFGWTLLGWVICLAWSVSNNTKNS